jgi:hypothetical protein
MKIINKNSKSIRFLAEGYEDRCFLTEISDKMNNNNFHHEHVDIFNSRVFEHHERVFDLTLYIVGSADKKSGLKTLSSN